MSRSLNPLCYFNLSPEVLRLAVMMNVKYPLSRRNFENLLTERGSGLGHETVRFWWQRCGPMFAAEVPRRRVSRAQPWR